MHLYAIRRVSGWVGPDALGRAVQRSRRTGEEMPGEVSWIRSYVVHERDGALGMVCVYRATSAESLREHAARAGLPVSAVYAIADTLILRHDPR